MSTSHRRSLLPSFAALAAACVAVAAPDARARSDAAGWTPALAALSDRAAGGPIAGAAPALAAAPVAAPLLAAGMQAAAETPATPELAERTPELGRDETQRWVPGFAFTSGILGQNAEGTVGTTSTVSYNYFARQDGVSFVSNPLPLPCNTVVPSILPVTRSLAEGKAIPTINNNTTNFVRVTTGVCNKFTAFNNHLPVLPVGNNDLFLTPTVGSSFELMSPGLQDVPGRPRLFVHGDTTLAFSFDRNVAKQGTPTGAVIPLDPNTGKLSPITPEVEIRGLGAKTSGQVEQWVFGAGLGPAFTFEAFERRLRVKPSFEWMREEIQVSGVLNKTFQVDTGVTQGRDVGVPGGGLTPSISAVYLNEIVIRARDTQDFNGIGGGLELEMDAARAGPVMLSLFLAGQAYKMLGDLDVPLHGETVVPAQPPYTTVDQTVSADFDFNIHSWAYHGGVGLRFRWLPED